MQEYLIILKGNNKDLGIFEFETLWETYTNEKIKLKNIKNILYRFKTKNKLSPSSDMLKRLTYTNFISETLIKSDTLENLYKQIPEKIKKYNNKTFRVRIKKSRIKYKIDFITEKELAKPIWDNFQNPKVSIDNYEIEYNYIFVENKEEIYFAKKIYENDKDYLRRMPKLRPIKMPYTLKSDMARIAINFLNLKKGIVLDPFCGIGGILIEAKDMGFEIIGNDISWNDLKYFKTNFEHYFPKSPYLRTLADSKTQFLKENTVDGIVTDIPYGKSSRKFGKELYEQFLISAKKYLKPNKRMVIIYANFVEFKQLAKKHFTEVKEIEEYINKSMTRHILVLENKK